MGFLVIFIQKAIGQGIGILYGALGEIMTEKSGNLNLGIPGMMYMGGAMALIMLAFMLGMYRNRMVNAVIVVGAVVVFGAGLALVRTQATVGDVAWMRAMIPHHSIAILTSERAHLEDPRVRELADSIIEAQRKEIEEMKAYIKELE